ncbi:cyclase family protein [Catellatospora coxensis]
MQGLDQDRHALLPAPSGRPALNGAIKPWEAVRGRQVIDLAQPMRRGMPQSPNHPPFRMALERRHGDMMRPDGGSAANELIVTGGHVGTHVDALSHVSQDGLLHGGRPAGPLQSHQGFSDLGIDTFPPYLGRAVVLDVARAHGVDVLPAGYAITPEDLDRAAAGLTLAPGEVILIGTGWSRRWSEHDAFIGSRDGTPARTRRPPAGWPPTPRRRRRGDHRLRAHPRRAATPCCPRTGCCWSSTACTSSRR